MVVRIGGVALVVGIVTLTTGCLTGLGLPPSKGGGGQSGSNQMSTSLGAAPGGGGSGAEGGPNGFDGGPGSGGAGPGNDAHPGGVNAFRMERWVSQQGSFITGAKWLAGDFDGDGRTDLAAVYNDLASASIDVWLSMGSTFVRQRWATRQGGFWDTQKWFAGDFDGDGHADLANVFNDQNQIAIDVHLWTPNGFIQQRWATLQGYFWDAQQWLAGDFDGDGDADLANVFDDDGDTSIDLHHSTRSTFRFQRWMTRKIPFSDTQKWLSGGLAIGDAGTPFLTVFNDAGRVSIDRYLRSGTTLVRAQQAQRISPFSPAQKWFAGNFGWSAGADLATVFNDNGQASIDVVMDTTEQRWATRQGGFWDSQQWLAGDFDNDQVSDLANVFSDNGFISIDVHRNPRP